MNKIFKWSLIALSAVTVGCNEDLDDGREPVAPAYSGDDVVFTFASQDARSRTMYADPWSETGSQQIYWGNYITNEAEYIKVYCRESDGNMAVYKVYPDTKENTSVAIDIAKAEDDVSIKWGAMGSTYEFYGFYPASSAGAFIGETGHVISAQIDPGQTPKLYKSSVNGGALTVTTLDDIAKNNTQGIDKRTVIYAMPNMEAAIMMAHTSVAGTPDEATQTGYGYPVSLDFHVLADVLDITVNGPISSNTLGGNLNEGIPAQFIKIMSVDVKAKNGEMLVGKFTLDMDTKEVTPLSGNSIIKIVTADKGQYPTLHVRSDNVSKTDQLRLRAFIMPGQITDLNQLEITVHTDCGDYTQPLKPFSMFEGAIHPIKLGYFIARGTEFDFKNWISQLDPNIYVSELSIPGTWHSSNAASQGADDIDLKKQYDAGIRAFEVHTKNGTKLYTNYDFGTELTAENASYGDPVVTTKFSRTNWSGGSFTAENIPENTRPVTADNVTITLQKSTISASTANRYALRLYRTALNNDGKETSLSNAIISLGSDMNPKGLMFLEIGMDGESEVSGLPVKETTTTETATLTGVTLTGTQTKTWIQSWNRHNPTLENCDWATATYNGRTIALDDLGTLVADGSWTASGGPTESYTTTTIPKGLAWATAVSSCLRNLQNTTNDKTGKPLLYSGELNRNTTIKDVQGQIIVKVNTNEPNNNFDNERADRWGAFTPALFSRWVNGSGSTPLTVNLKWGAPAVPPTPLDESDEALRWCYTELDNISDINNRKNALSAFLTQSYTNYSKGLHRTFYECAIGGFLNGNPTAANYQAAAKELNPELLRLITDPNRKPSPLGLVLMSYALGDNDTYRSADLIRAVINNNSAFLLNRATTQP